MQGTNGDVYECVTVWEMNMDWHQHVAGQSYEKRTLVGVSYFMSGLVRTQDWNGHGLGSGHAEGRSQRQLLSREGNCV